LLVHGKAITDQGRKDNVGAEHRLLSRSAIRRMMFKSPMWITPLPPPLTALEGRSHGSILNGNYAPNRLSSAWKPTSRARRRHRSSQFVNRLSEIQRPTLPTPDGVSLSLTAGRYKLQSLTMSSHWPISQTSSPRSSPGIQITRSTTCCLGPMPQSPNSKPWPENSAYLNAKRDYDCKRRRKDLNHTE